VIDPTATLLSAAMMLEHFGFATEARALEMGVDLVYAEGRSLTPDQGGDTSTEAFCEAVAAAMTRARAAIP
jgi:isocitrate/isopropylmalate dehydrogenase